ncbi:MAG TPA: hypothetical protein VGS00_06260 [Thermoanaerobaculia bacterium]|nr:hypothetical protein [Thermoanaerobaculia bacterium]
MTAPQDEKLLETMIERQRQKLLALARRIVPRLTPEDLLQPHNHPSIAAHPDFNFEDGILAGYLAALAALRAQRQK